MVPRLLLAGLAVLAAAGCGGGDASAPESSEANRRGAEERKAPAEPAAEERPADAIEQSIVWRARALQAGDGAAMAQIAAGRQRARDKVAARRADRMGVDHFSVAVDDVRIDGDRAKARVLAAYKFNGVKRSSYAARRVELRRSGDEWLVTSDRAQGYEVPWEVAPFAVSRGPNVLLLTPPGVGAEPLRDGLAQAYREIRRNLPARDLPRRVLVIAARDVEQAERLSGRIAGGVIALANVRVDFGPRPALQVERVLEQRLIVIDSRWRSLPPDEQMATLVHEMTHTALNPDTSGRTPPWLVEGVAMYVSGDDRAEEARLRAAGAAQSTTLRKLCEPTSIFRLGAAAQGAAYAASSGAAEAIVAQHGTEALFELYDAFNDPELDANGCAATTDRVMRRTIGISLAELEAAVAGG